MSNFNYVYKGKRVVKIPDHQQGIICGVALMVDRGRRYGLTRKPGWL
jgi:hypothetical protein